MAVYTRNQPIAGDDLDVSQPKLVSNTNGADDAFGMDHYPFSNTTGNRGFHNTVTQPPYQNPLGTVASVIPVTTVNPIIYAFQPLTAPDGTPTTKLGIIQYSIPTPNDPVLNPYGNAIPTPITSLQSPAAGINLVAGTTTNVLDFTGIPRAIAMLSFIVSNGGVFSVSGPIAIGWSGSAFAPFSSVTVVSSGNILQIKNASINPWTGLYWTLQFLRVQ